MRHLGGDVREELEELGKRLDDDKVAREAVAPALLLIQAERLGGDEKAYKDTLRYFATVVSGAIGGDGHVSAAGRGEVGLTCGERPIALLWGAAFAAHGIRAEVRDIGRGFYVVASGGDAVRLARLYFLYGPPLLEKDERNANHKQDDRLMNHRLAETVELGARTTLNINWKGFRRTKSGHVAADLVISEGGVDIKYNVYLRNDILLEFGSTDRGRVELAARLLRLAGVSTEVKEKNDEGAWYVWATTDRLVAGHKKLKDALTEIVEAARDNGWVDASKAERWLEKLRSGITLRKGWPRHLVRLVEGALDVRYQSTNPEGIERETRRLRAMGLVEDIHFTVKMPEGGGAGYVRILREGLERAAWLSVHGEGDQQRLAAEFVDLILKRAEKEGKDVRKKAEEIVRRGREVGSLKLEGFEKEVGGRLVKVIGGGAQPERSKSGKTLLRIKITAEMDGIRGDYTMTFGRYGKNNAAMGYAYISAKAPDSGKVYAGRFAALIKALTGEEPKVYEREDGIIVIKCGGGCLEGLARYAELADAIAKWLEETGRR
ncbi:MAG: PaRep2b protein [Thermoproteus sp.]